MDCTNIIGEKIKSLRTNQEISIQELAERAGLTVEQVSRIEENIDIPSLAPLIKIIIRKTKCSGVSEQNVPFFKTKRTSVNLFPSPSTK